MPERSVTAELEAAVDSADALDERAPEARVPAAARPELLDVVEELLDGRVEAVGSEATSGTGERRRTAARTASPETRSGGSGRRSRSACAAA